MSLSNGFHNIVRSFSAHVLVLLAIAVLTTATVTAQKDSLLNPSANIDQCANGSFAAPVQCTGVNWQNGNVGSNNGHYAEGDSIAYRIRFQDLDTSISHSVTIEWDTTQTSKHAIDYLTTYNRTEVFADPCSGVASCGTATPFAIPADPNIPAGIVQIPGVFTMWGGTITSVGVSPYYALSGTYAGSSSTRITITFTSTETDPVLAWGGHIATQGDWANFGGSASNITGSPYHTRLIDLDGSGGNQDRSLSIGAMPGNSKITIIKDLVGDDSPQGFNFTTMGAGLSNFTLFDDGTPNNATSNSKTFNNLLAPNTSGMFSVTESQTFGFTLSDITCAVSNGGSSTTVTNLLTQTVNITLQSGDAVTCRFTNTRLNTSAAGVTVSGRVLTADLAGLTNATVELVDEAGNVRTARTSAFGYYSFDDVEVGQVYIVSVNSKRMVFGTRVVSLLDAMSDLDFIAGQ